MHPYDAFLGNLYFYKNWLDPTEIYKVFYDVNKKELNKEEVCYRSKEIVSLNLQNDTQCMICDISVEKSETKKIVRG